MIDRAASAYIETSSGAKEFDLPDYSHREVTDKLGVKVGHAVALDDRSGRIDWELRCQVLLRTGRCPAEPGERVNVVLVAATVDTDTMGRLREWRERILPDGAIWLLTPKRGVPGYVNGTDLIACGVEAGLVDNKICSVSSTTSAMRFVIRHKDRVS